MGEASTRETARLFLSRNGGVCWSGPKGVVVDTGVEGSEDHRDMTPPNHASHLTRASRPVVGISSYRTDALYARVVRAVETLLARGKVVAPVDVLVEMGLLDRPQLEEWRLGRVPYLEMVIHGNLARLSRLLRILRFHAHDLNLVPSSTAYLRQGKGPKQRLRFTKTGDPNLEAAYSRHFVWPGKGPFHSPVSKERKTTNTGRSAPSSRKTSAETEASPGTSC